MMKKKELDKLSGSKLKTADDLNYLANLEEYLSCSSGPWVEKISDFPKYAPRKYVTRFLSRYELFKQVLHIQGSIIECGVFAGAGLMSFLQLSSIFEPINHQRRIIGFDTFEGFPEVHKKDKGKSAVRAKKGQLASDSYQELLKAIMLYDKNRFLNHIPKVELVKGNACQTIPLYIKENPHLIVSLLYLDFDIYEPTLAALQNFFPRMPKGAILVFDELNTACWPGETLAVLEAVGINKLKIQRFPFDSLLSYAVIE